MTKQISVCVYVHYSRRLLQNYSPWMSSVKSLDSVVWEGGTDKAPPLPVQPRENGFPESTQRCHQQTISASQTFTNRYEICLVKSTTNTFKCLAISIPLQMACFYHSFKLILHFSSTLTVSVWLPMGTSTQLSTDREAWTVCRYTRRRTVHTVLHSPTKNLRTRPYLRLIWDTHTLTHAHTWG